MAQKYETDSNITAQLNVERAYAHSLRERGLPAQFPTLTPLTYQDLLRANEYPSRAFFNMDQETALFNLVKAGFEPEGRDIGVAIPQGQGVTTVMNYAVYSLDRSLVDFDYRVHGTSRPLPFSVEIAPYTIEQLNILTPLGRQHGIPDSVELRVFPDDKVDALAGQLADGIAKSVARKATAILASTIRLTDQAVNNLNYGQLSPLQLRERDRYKELVAWLQASSASDKPLNGINAALYVYQADTNMRNIPVLVDLSVPWAKDNPELYRSTVMILAQAFQRVKQGLGDTSLLREMYFGTPEALEFVAEGRGKKLDTQIDYPFTDVETVQALLAQQSGRPLSTTSALRRGISNPPTPLNKLVNLDLLTPHITEGKGLVEIVDLFKEDLKRRVAKGESLGSNAA